VHRKAPLPPNEKFDESDGLTPHFLAFYETSNL